MKKNAFLILTLTLTVFNCYSQILSPNGNNIFYYNGAADVTLRFEDRGSGGRAIVHYPNNILSLNYGGDFTGGTLIGNDVFFKDGGNSYILSRNVGIGTTNPNSKLTIRSGFAGVSIDPGSGQNSYFGSIAFNRECGTGEIFDNRAYAFQINNGNNVYDKNLHFQIYNGDGVQITNNALVINGPSGGNVGIGTANPDAKLAVNGTIHSKEVKVDMTGWTWPDFVFKKEYSLPTLDEVEKHIAEKGHLENIPSEEEVLKNGINLGEMNAKLLQKIEELTLYMIEMKKENGEIKKENAEIKRENEEMRNRIEKIERK